MNVLLALLLAHVVGQFVLSPPQWLDQIKRRRMRAKALYARALLHGLLAWLALWLAGLSADGKLLLASLVIALLHLCVDAVTLMRRTPTHRAREFLMAHSVHLLSIALICVWLSPSFIQALHAWQPPWMLWLLTWLLLTRVSSTVIRVIIAHWAPHTEYNSTDSLKHAGLFIGYLERLTTFGLAISGHLAAVGFLIAAKSIFRFGDLTRARDRKLTEYILIGTFLSFSLALLISALYLQVRPLFA